MLQRIQDSCVVIYCLLVVVLHGGTRISSSFTAGIFPSNMAMSLVITI